MISFIVPQQGKCTIRKRIVRHCALIGGKRCSDDVVSRLALISHSRLGLYSLTYTKWFEIKQRLNEEIGCAALFSDLLAMSIRTLAPRM